MYYIYALIDPRTELPFYIGKEKEGNNRHFNHFSETKSSNRHKTYKINYLLEAGYDIQTQILHSSILNEIEAYEIETMYIQKYGRVGIDQDGILTNICLNAIPPDATGRKQSKEHIKKRIDSFRKYYEINGPRIHSDETKLKISEKMRGTKNPFYGKTHTTEFKLAHSKRMAGNKRNAKTFCFIDPNQTQYIVVGEFVKFCHDNNLPTSTMEKAMYNNSIPKLGKAKGWTVTKVNNTELKAIT
jgi:group I intron endonuclease